jgi:small subunit ribosomal protein S34
MSTGQKLHNVVNGLRYFGVGSKVTRSIYQFPDTYWIITKVKLTVDQEHGKIWGRLVWRGRPKPKEMKINTAKKKEWSLLGVPDYKEFKGETDQVQALIPPPGTERTC